MTEPAGKREIAAAAGAAIAAAEGEQLALLLPPSRFEGSPLPHPVPEHRRAGRPAGAKNLATREILSFVRKMFGDPLVERARWLMLSPEAMAAELGCSKAEAFDRQDRIRADLARLYYAPLAPVDGDGNAAVPFLQLVMGGRVAGGQGVAPWLTAPGVVHPEKLNEINGAAEPSQTDPSHVEAK